MSVPAETVVPPWYTFPVVKHTTPVPTVVMPPAAALESPSWTAPIGVAIVRLKLLASSVAPPARTSISVPRGMVKSPVACSPPPSKLRTDPLPPRLLPSSAATKPAAAIRLPEKPEASVLLRSSVPLPILVSVPLPVMGPSLAES